MAPGLTILRACGFDVSGNSVPGTGSDDAPDSRSHWVGMAEVIPLLIERNSIPFKNATRPAVCPHRVEKGFGFRGSKSESACRASPHAEGAR